MIKKYQQGGTSNIAIGSPKPYTANLPGINLSGIQGALTNAPIEINTTSIFDQLDKMQRLKLDADKLKFQYEELKYKEGKAYMDFAADMMKTMQTSVKSNLSGIGGFSSMPRYEPVIRSYNERMAEVREKFTRGFQNRDPHAAMNLLNEVSKIQTDPDYLQAIGEIGYLEKITDHGIKNPSLTTGRMLTGTLDFASNPTADFSKFVGDTTPYMANNLKSDDIFKIFENYRTGLHKSTEGTKTEVGSPKILPSGLVEKQHSYSYKTPEQIANDLAAMFMSSAGTKQYLETEVHADGTPVNPENPQDVIKYLMPVAQGLHDDIKSSFVSTRDTSGSVQKDVEVVNGRLVSTPKPGDEDGTGGKQTEGDKKREARKNRVISEFGLSALSDATVRELLFGGDDWYEQLSSYMKSQGKSPRGANEKATSSKTLNINSLDELGIAYDKDKTKLFKSPDGKTYLITNEEQVTQHVDKKWKDTPKRKDLWDREVRKLTGISEEEWDLFPVLDENTNVYTIEPKQAKSEQTDMPDVPKDISVEINKNRIIRNMNDVDKQYVAAFLGSENIQEIFFDEVLLPRIQDKVKYLRDTYPEKTKNFSDNKLAYIVHHQGEDGAEYFFENNFKTKKSGNSSSASELAGALDSIGEGDLKEEIARIESNNNPYIVYKGDQPSSAAGKYQVLVKTWLDDIKRIVDENLFQAADAQTQSIAQSTPQPTQVSPVKTGKFFNAFQDSLKANPNFNIAE